MDIIKKFCSDNLRVLNRTLDVNYSSRCVYHLDSGLNMRKRKPRRE